MTWWKVKVHGSVVRVTAKGITVSKFHLGGMKRESPGSRPGVTAQEALPLLKFINDVVEREMPRLEAGVTARGITVSKIH